MNRPLFSELVDIRKTSSPRWFAHATSEVFGREVAGVLGSEADGGGGEGQSPPWLDEIDCEAGLPRRRSCRAQKNV